MLEDDLRKPVKITDLVEENKFFAESTYVVDLIGSNHRYIICWMGPKLGGQQISATSTAMDELCGGVLTSEMTRFRVRKGHEDATFM